MRTFIRVFVILVALMVGSCGSNDSGGSGTNNATTGETNNATTGTNGETPTGPQLPQFECSGDTIVGTAATGDSLVDLGVTDVAYELDLVTNDISLELLDEAGDVVANVDLGVRLEDIVTAKAEMTVTDASGSVQLTEKSRVQFIPGLGSRIETERTAGGETIEIWDVLSSDPAVGAQELAVASSDFAGSPEPTYHRRTPAGEYEVFTVYDPTTQEFAERADIDAWADQAGVSKPVNGEWETLAAEVFRDEKWRVLAMAHFTTCELGEQTLVSTFQGLQTADPDDDSKTVRQAQSCEDEEEIRETQRFISEKLDTLSNVTGGLGDATIKGIIIANADKLGIKGTHEIPGFGKITITPGTISAFADVVTNLKKGAAVATLMTNPVGIGLAGISAGAYIAARVNDAFGDDIIRAWKERQKQNAIEAAEEAEREREERRARERRQARSNQDPHIRGFDGTAYDLQAEGDFLLARATSGPPFEVHSRLLPVALQCDNVTYNWGFATKVGNTRVSTYADEAQHTIRLDGELYDIPIRGALFLEGGGIVSSRGQWTYVTYPSGEVAKIHRKKDVRFNIHIVLPESRRGAMEGIFGNFNGDGDDDVRTRDGRVFEEPVKWDVIHGEFRDEWLLSADESLLDYDAGKTPDDYFNPDTPGRPMTVDELPPDEAQRAQGVCEEAGVEHPVQLENCILDVVCMGDDSEADLHAEEIPPEKKLDVEMPIFLDGWTVEGPVGNGNWQVAPDGRSVEQLQNGQPTFFVSPEDYQDVTVTGSFLTNDGDDDYMGFVFGYNGPFEAEGDDPNDYDFLLLSWKKRDQDIARAGFTLSRASGVITEINPTFWGQTNTPEYEVLATDFGDGRRWTTGAEHDFELSYGGDRIRIAVDGREIFDVSAADAGVAQFPSGRFGFYNYSQSNVIYSDFGAVDGARDVGVDAFEIDDFSPVAGDFSLARGAVIEGGMLRLTDVDGSASVGNAWLSSKLMINEGFSTEFTFKVGEPGETNERGFAFVMQNADEALNVEGNGNPTGALGYERIRHSVAIEFDAVRDAFDPDVPHVSVQTRYDDMNEADHASSLGSASSPDFADGRIHWAKITYDGAQFSVFVDDPTTPVLTAPVDLSGMRFDDGHAYVGFAAQRELPTTFDILSWSYASSP